MRRFIVRAHDLPTKFGLSLDDLPGNGRLDLVARTVNAAMLTSHGVREDVELTVSARDAAIRLDGSSLGGLNPDERSIAGVLAEALPAVSQEWKSTTPGVESCSKSFEELLEDLEAFTVVRSSGQPIADADPADHETFVLSDHRPFTGEEKQLLKGSASLGLGPVEVHTDHSIAVLNNWLDTSGYSSYGSSANPE